MARSSAVMKTLVFFICSLHLSSSVTHSLQYTLTGIAPGINFPEFTALGLMDGEQFGYYDSNIGYAIPKTEWMQKVKDDDPDHWKTLSEVAQIQHQSCKKNVGKAMHCFNPSAGVHTLQRILGCELDDAGTVRGYNQFGYDGEDFISLDLNTLTWTTDKPEALIIKNKRDNNTENNKMWKNFLEYQCIEWLKKYMPYSRKTLGRKDPPTSSVFQKLSPSPEMVCHATGFFPKEVNITWRKDGEDVKEDVEFRETLPNQDGSFQKRIILKVPAEDLQKHKYTCVIQHSSLKEDLVLNVKNEHRILRGRTGIVIIVVIVLFLLFGVAVCYIRNYGRALW